MRIRAISFIFLFLLSVTFVFGQDQNDNKIKVYLDDGSVINGVFTSKDDVYLYMKNEILEDLIIPIERIKNLKYISQEDLYNNEVEEVGIAIDSTIGADILNSTRYFVSPSGYGLKKGQKYYENIWIFWNSVTFGISDNFSITAGTELISVLFSENFPLIYANGKFSIPFKNNKGAFGINATYLTIPSDNFNSFAFLTGSLTLGDRNNNFTLGAGAGFDVGDGINDEVVPFTLSYMGRLSKKFSIVTENWLIVENDFDDVESIVSAGFRYHFNERGSALNVALVRPLNAGFDFIAIPFVSASVGF